MEVQRCKSCFTQLGDTNLREIHRWIMHRLRIGIEARRAHALIEEEEHRTHPTTICSTAQEKKLRLKDELAGH